MKKKKTLMVIAIIFIALMMGMSVSSHAATTQKFGLKEYRKEREAEAGKQYGYEYLNKKVWEIVKYKSDNSVSFDDAIYCLKAGQGFFSETGDFLDPVEYNLSYDLKNKTSMTMGLPVSGEVYNSVLWILTNSYLPSSSTAQQDKELLYAKAGIANDSQLSDDEIEVVQQLAIWYYTNKEDSNYHREDESGAIFSAIYESSKIKDIQTAYEAIPTQRQNDAEKLYQYFISLGKENAAKELTDDAPVTLSNSQDPTLAEKGDQYILGPYQIDQINEKLYSLNMNLKDENHQDISGYLLVDENGNTFSDIKATVGKKFYLSIPKASTAKSFHLKIQGNYQNTNMTYWTKGGSSAIIQPLVILDKVAQEIVLEKTVNIKDFDLSLRKFVSKVGEQEINRAPTVDSSKLDTMIDGKKVTTAIYNQPKTPVAVKTGDTVIYTIRVYNEGDIDGYVGEVTDYLPAQLEFINDDFNAEYGWKLVDGSMRKITTTKLAYSSNPADQDQNIANLMKAYDGTTVSYRDLKVKCKVKSDIKSKQKITNVAEITLATNEAGQEMTDRDSQIKNISLPNEEELPEYKQSEIDANQEYIAGQQDDDDFEKLVLEEFDLALRKFISGVNGVNTIGRQPVANAGKVATSEAMTAVYDHTKKPLAVKRDDVVTYTVRVYNEAEISGYASKITDYLPEELEFLPNDPINKKYEWVAGEDNRTITTDYLAKAKETNERENSIKAFDGTTVLYKEVQINCKVKQTAQLGKKLTNLAQISAYTDEKGQDIVDRDSESNNMQYPTDENLSVYQDEEIKTGKTYIPGQQDDDDFEKVFVSYFDLALRKFITNVNEVELAKTRAPIVKAAEEGKVTYEHSKDPVEVVTGDVVTYTIRVYNEGLISGYANQVVDDIPQGLTFMPDHETNKAYKWKLSEDEKQVTTNYLAKEQEKTEGSNLIAALDKEKEISATNPSYKEVKIAFKVTEPTTSDRIITNTAEIADDRDSTNQPIEDIDSVPGNNNEWNKEDDLDKEFVRVKYFDLTLKKWVSKVIVTQEGKQTVSQTGHTGEEDPEPIVKVDLKRKEIKKLTVQFEFQIKVTNEGEIAGYAKEVTDYIPEGLKFVAEDNKGWYVRNDNPNKVATKALENKLLQPGESATVPIILTWINGEDNLGLKTNVAEISKDGNSSNTPDIDSTPDNKKAGEDDIDDAPVMIGIELGQNMIYYGLFGVILGTIAVGSWLIKKFVL